MVFLERAQLGWRPLVQAFCKLLPEKLNEQVGISLIYFTGRIRGEDPKLLYRPNPEIRQKARDLQPANAQNLLGCLDAQNLRLFPEALQRGPESQKVSIALE